MKLKKGQVIWVKLNGRGSEQNGIRPSVIVQNNVGNRFSPTTIIVPLTCRTPKKTLPTHLRLKGKTIGPKFKDSTILTEQIKNIDISRVFSIETQLPNDIIRKIDNKMAVSLGMNLSVS